LRGGRVKRWRASAASLRQPAARANKKNLIGERRKIYELLLRRLPWHVKVPARSTIHDASTRSGGKGPPDQNTRRGKRPLSAGLSPNDLWYRLQGRVQLGNKRYCYPLTVTDYASRYLLLCEAMDSNREQPAFLAFERLFRERGFPVHSLR